jgi:hypothetical protein
VEVQVLSSALDMGENVRFSPMNPLCDTLPLLLGDARGRSPH